MPIREEDRRALAARVERVVQSTPALDIHTHLYDPAFGPLLLGGIDELLVYHYLVAEGFRTVRLPFGDFWNLPKTAQADLLWRELFLERSPVSEACRGVVTTLNRLGLDPRASDLAALRGWFAAQDPAAHLDRSLALANLRGVTMTNSPFDDLERPIWDRGVPRDGRFLAALRIDPLLVAWPQTIPQLRAWGYPVTGERTPLVAAEVRRFLADWTGRMDARYCMVSLPPTFAWPADTDAAWLIEHAVLPHGREHGQPFALMLGVKRAVNPALQLAGDGVGRSDLAALEHLCAAHPDNRFLVTCLARENQHELCVLARKFRNLHVFGCWWFTNTPLLIGEITRMRLELLGLTFTPQHSDARVLEQVIYKWDHTRAILAGVLTDKYTDLAAAGWTPTEPEIARDVQALLGGAFERFLASS